MQSGLLKNKNIAFFIALLLLIVSIVMVENKVLHFTNGILVYPLDDTYIHMSIAKHLAQNGVWGINANEFSSASSSILYTLTLAALFKIFSVQTIIPFILNFVVAIVLLVVIQRRLQKENIKCDWQLIILLLAVFFTPLFALVVSGMEHTLQCLFSFLLIFNFSEWMSDKKNATITSNKLPLSVYVNGILVCAIRYEGLFIVAIICCILLYEKNITASFSLGFISLLPIIIFGFLSIIKGSYFLPNSVLLKSSPVQSTGSGIKTFISNILIDKLTIPANGITSLSTQRLLLLLPVTYLAFKKFFKKNSSYKYIILILTICTLLQLSFASTGWFYRYEAYLILNSIIVVSIISFKYGKQFIMEFKKGTYPAIFFVLLILFFPLILRSAAAYTKASQACVNIYEQQYQMGNFLKKYYNNDTIALNDIGAASFFTHGKIVDLWGLADIDVAKAKKDHTNTPAFLYNHANNKNVKLAIVYDSWFDSSLTNKWQKVATWTIKNNVICGDSIVSFYALKSENISILKNNIDSYKNILPNDVNVVIYK